MNKINKYEDDTYEYEPIKQTARTNCKMKREEGASSIHSRTRGGAELLTPIDAPVTNQQREGVSPIEFICKFSIHMGTTIDRIGEVYLFSFYLEKSF